MYVVKLVSSLQTLHSLQSSAAAAWCLRRASSPTIYRQSSERVVVRGGLMCVCVLCVYVYLLTILSYSLLQLRTTTTTTTNYYG